MNRRPPRPRWSNYRIGALPMRVRLEHPPWYTAQSVIDGCRIVRDDYEDEVERLCQRILDLEALIERGDKEWWSLARRIDELERKLPREAAP